ncbi:uncharacterized protein LOC117645912 [Thrips palmi]|uniref:DNA-directed DNA polymerase n=1 Tax=Thrips palmi TaxID=161013 RepID=A0A6P8YQT1_THRPL|nr:uncharacterized protein LOC117645912 [Thrips palmi]
MKFPAAVRDINTFEKGNPALAINVFSCEVSQGKALYFPLRISAHCKTRQTLSLLYYNEHYGYITSKSSLFSSQISKSDRHKRFYCDRCLYPFSTSGALKEHEAVCGSNNQIIVMPKGENATVKFTRFEFTEPVNFRIIFDTESLLVPIATARPSPLHSWNNKTQEHHMFTFTFMIVDYMGRVVTEPTYYSGWDAADVLLSRLLEEAKKLLDRPELPMGPLSPAEILRHDQATQCERCLREFSEHNPKRHHHNHCFGNYVGPLCNECNLRIKHESHVIKAYAHNLKGYDGLSLLRAIARRFDANIDHFSAVPKTICKYITFRYNCLQFCDTLQFMPASLDSLINSLAPHEFGIFEAHFQAQPADVLKALRQKLPCPYEALTGPEVLSEPRLPPIESFYSSLSESCITQSEYEHALYVFEVMGCQSVGDYLRLYNIVDVLMLACVWHSFVTTNRTNYALDPSHFITAPSYYYQCCLFKSKETLELVQDVNMYWQLNNNIRGGFAGAFKRVCIANNPQVSNYDPQKELTYLGQFDLNSLYTTTQATYSMPTSGYRYLSESELRSFELGRVNNESAVGFLICCDLHYPDDIKEKTRYLPLCPTNELVTYSMLSGYNKKFLQKYKLRFPPGVRKLLATQLDKKEILLHGEALVFYLRHGLQLTKIHYIIEFKQSFWLRDWVNLNNDLRRSATTTTQSNAAKAACNSGSYGSFLLRKQRFRNVRFEGSSGGVKKAVRMQLVSGWQIVEDNCVAIETKPRRVVMDRPLIVALCILDLSKIILYRFFYDIFSPLFGPSLKCAYLDTDSLLLEVQGVDMYKELHKVAEHLDTSNFPTEHPLYDPTGKQKLNRIKDQYGGRIIRAGYFLRSKLYAIVTEDNEITKKAKGVKKSAVRNRISLADYISCLAQQGRMMHSFTRLDVEGFRIFTKELNRVSLSSYDDKVFVKMDGTILPYGHPQAVDGYWRPWE